MRSFLTFLQADRGFVVLWRELLPRGILDRSLRGSAAAGGEGCGSQSGGREQEASWTKVGNTDGAGESTRESNFCNLQCFANNWHTGQWPQCPGDFGEDQRMRSFLICRPGLVDRSSGWSWHPSSGLLLSLPILMSQCPSQLLTGPWGSFPGVHPDSFLSARICKPAT